MINYINVFFLLYIHSYKNSFVQEFLRQEFIRTRIPQTRIPQTRIPQTRIPQTMYGRS